MILLGYSSDNCSLFSFESNQHVRTLPWVCPCNCIDTVCAWILSHLYDRPPQTVLLHTQHTLHTFHTGWITSNSSRYARGCSAGNWNGRRNAEMSNISFSISPLFCGILNFVFPVIFHRTRDFYVMLLHFSLQLVWEFYASQLSWQHKIGVLVTQLLLLVIFTTSASW